MITVIAGASSGIGKATALLLGQDGRFRVFAGLERDEDAGALHDAPSTVTPITMDVTDASSIRQAVEIISRHATDGWSSACTDSVEEVEKWYHPDGDGDRDGGR